VLRPARECRQSGQAVEEMEGEELNDEKLAPRVIVVSSKRDRISRGGCLLEIEKSLRRMGRSFQASSRWPLYHIT